MSARGDVTRTHVTTCGYCDAQLAETFTGWHGDVFPEPSKGGWCIVGNRLVCPAHTVIVKDEPSPGGWTAVRHEAKAE